MNKREAAFGVKFRAWLKSHPLESALFELKQTTTDSLPFSDVLPHQLDWLRAAKSGYGALYKPPDNQGVQLPCDYWYVRNGGGWVVIRYPGLFAIIDVDTFIRESKSSKRKSLTSTRALEISTHHELY